MSQGALAHTESWKELNFRAVVGERSAMESPMPILLWLMGVPVVLIIAYMLLT
jgi:hypothetical protein